MAHGSNNAGTQRESTSLYRSAEGVDPRPNNIGNISLSQRKNNPTSSGPVKHSDFIVDHINGLVSSKPLAGNILYLKRGETATITMTFTGAAKGFLDETRYTPQNFTWGLKDSTKLAILETSSTSGTYTDGSHRAYKVTIKNIWNECSDTESDEHVTCNFKDHFNNNLDSAHGYDNTFKIDVRVRGVGLETVTGLMSNGNNSADHAYDNRIHGGNLGKNYSPDQPDMFTRFWQGRKASQGRTLTTYKNKLDAEEIVMRSVLQDKPGWSQSPGYITRDLITGIEYQWQKYVGNNWIKVVDNTEENRYFHKRVVENVVTGNFEGWTVGNPERRLHIQGTESTGNYRLVIRVTIDATHPFTCQYVSNEQSITVHEAIKSVTMNSPAYICSDASPTHTTIIAQADYMGDESVTYELYKKHSQSKTEILYQTKSKIEGEEAEFNVPITEGDAYYMVRAKFTGPKAGVRAGGGECWSTTHITIPTEWRQTTGTGGTDYQWYDRTSIMRRVLQPPPTPLITIQSREGVARNVITFTVSSPTPTLPPYHVFNDVQWKIEAVDVVGNTTTPFPWQTANTNATGSQIFTKTLPAGVTLYFYAKQTLKGDMHPDLIGPSQTNTICESALAQDQSYTINCAQTALIAPFGSNVVSGYTGDREVIFWEDRSLKEEHLAEDINATRPDGTYFRINSRSKDPASPSVKVSNSSNVMATNILVKEPGQPDQQIVASGTTEQTINFNSANNKWELQTITSFGNKTPSGKNYPHRYNTRRINR